jgi:uncharacterized membrane protein (DUF2068 family)
MRMWGRGDVGMWDAGTRFFEPVPPPLAVWRTNRSDSDHVPRQRGSFVNAQSANSNTSPKSRSGVVTLIGVTKLFEALLLLVLATGALRLLHHDDAESIKHGIRELHLDPEGRYLSIGIGKLLSVNPKTLKELSVAAYIYFALHFTEGVGLLLHKRWAEYFTVISTSLLVPLEIYELCHKFSGAKVGVLIANLVIVAYLVYRLWKERKPKDVSADKPRQITS